MIKSFYEFINELRITKPSKTGYTKEVDNILDDPTTNKSLSAGLMLRNKLSEEEMDSEIQSLNLKELKIKWPILNAFRRKKEELILLMSNFNFLIDELKDNGEILCEYCNKGPLYVYDTFTDKKYDTTYIKKQPFVKSNGATCDHKEPISKGGDKFSKDNLAVCCSQCNGEKGNMSYSDWMKISKYKKYTKRER
jgi:hypothetical protein